MKRIIDESLLNWKNSSERKPLLLHGARQVGKTYSIMEFGSRNYASVAYFYFDNNPDLSEIFESGITSIKSLITKLEAYANQSISPDKTLIVFDEIQNCRAALNSLKLFQQSDSDYHVMAAGSLLGVALNRKGYSFPVGKIDELKLYPLTFEEFLMEFNPHLIPLIIDCFNKDEPLSTGLHNQALELFLQYLVIGGMPEPINIFKETNDYTVLRARQLALCNNYILDMNKYTDTRTQAIRNEAVYNTLPTQLAKENRKFQYAKIKSGARATDYEYSLNWLEKAALIIKCNKVNEGKKPLANYEDFLSFKVYMNDVGLYNAKSNNSHLSVLGQTMSEATKGALSENYVAQQLVANDLKLYYWESNNQAELDFIIQIADDIIPLEVKSWQAVRSQSLEIFKKRYHVEKSLRISAKNFGYHNGIKNVPLYAVWCINNPRL